MEDLTKISEELSSKILTIGPDYKYCRGGVGAVIEVYSRYYEVYNFIRSFSYRRSNVFFKIYVFFQCLIKLFLTLASNRRIKIIHIHGSTYGSFYRKFFIFLVCKFIFRKKIIYHIHGGAFQLFYEKRKFLSKGLINTLVGNADILICLSQSWMKFYGQNFKIKKLIVLPNIIDYPVKTESSAKSDVINLLFLGFICKDKGIFDLIEVIAANKIKYKGRIKLFIGGSGEVQLLKELISKHQIEDLVEFLGWISNKKKEEVLNNSDVYILPSYYEGLPISILESMSYGKPIISSNVGGIPEIVKDKENGILINPGDLKQIEQAINSFLDHPELLKEYGASSEKMVQKHLPYSVVKELNGIYKSLLTHE